MKIVQSKYIKYFIIFTIFTLAYACIYKSWYFTFKPITNGDLGFLYKDYFTDLFHTLAPTWNSGINFGANTGSVLNYFGYNFWGALLATFGFDWNHIIRFIMFYPLLFGFVISTFFVSKLFRNTSVIALLFGFVFSINTFIFAWVNMMIAYAFLPILILVLYEYVKGKKIIWLFIFSIIFAYTVFYEIRVGFIAFLLSCIFVVFYWVYFPIPKKIFIKQIVQLGVSLGLVCLLSAFFILPLFHANNYSSISGITSQQLFGTQFYKLQYSLSLMQPYWNGETLKVFSLQPLKFYFWLYPIFAFSALFFAKKDKKILYFSTLAVFGIFMGKGANVPFGGIYAWVYHHLPFFNFFREPIEWWVIIGFSYAVLIAYFFYYFYQEIEKIVKRKFGKAIFLSSCIKLLVTLPIVFVMLSIAIPAYDGRLGHVLNPVSFPKEYEQLRQFLLKDHAFSRTLSVPSNQRFTFYNSTHPYVAFNYLPDSLKSLDTKLLSLESIRYIILPDDVLTDVFVNPYNKNQYANLIESAKPTLGYKSIKKVKGFGNISIWENPNDIPHIMAVKDLVYVVGSESISPLVGIPTSQQVAYYFEQTIPQGASKKTIDMVTNANDAMYKHATKLYAIATCIRCDLSKNYLDYVQFPFARFLPNNIFYPFIEIKESKNLQSVTSPEERFKQDTFFAEKRATEIQAMEKNPLTEKKYIVSTLGKENELIDGIEKGFKEIHATTIDNNFLASWDYVLAAKRTFDDLYQMEGDEQILSLLSKTIFRLDEMSTKISQKIWVTQGDEKKLIAILPEAGNYTIRMKNDDEAHLSDSRVTINGKNFQKLSIEENGYINFGNFQLSKDRYLVEVYVPSVNLLSLSLPPNENVKEDAIPIVSLKDPSAQYQLSFDYKITNGITGKIFISDDTYPINLNTENGNTILESVLPNNNDGEWHHYNKFFSPYTEITMPTLHLKENGRINAIEFRNLSLIKVVTPTIIFSKDTGNVLDTPKIFYQEITPTDYIITIEKATNPFFLSFSEQFDGSWTAFSTNQHVLGNSFTVSYFDTSVKELTSRNKIEPGILLDTFIHDNSLQALHTEVNVFSNGWLIHKSGTYQIHITFSPQKNFFIGLVISILTGISILITIGFLFVRKQKKH